MRKKLAVILAATMVLQSFAVPVVADDSYVDFETFGDEVTEEYSEDVE